MNHKRIVLTGGPSTGKTTIINLLKKRGYFCFDEVSRKIIKEYQNRGISKPFISRPKEFSDRLLLGRVSQYKDAIFSKNDISFYDRGIHDILAYMDYANEKIPSEYIKKASELSYNKIFIAAPWKEIHITDSERKESFEEALKIHKSLMHTYQNFGYTPTEIPFDTIKNRVDFILNTI